MREFNLDLNEESIFGMFVSPRLSTAVLDNQIRQSQIIAEAETALGSSVLTVAAARGLQQQGLSQAQARRGFQGASTIYLDYQEEQRDLVEDQYLKLSMYKLQN